MRNWLQEEKILIIKFGGLGDIILSLDAIFSIYSHHKNNKIILLTEQPFETILAKTGFFEEVLIIKRSLFYFQDINQIRKKTSSFSFSHVYDLQTSRRSSYYLKYFFEKGSITNGIGKYAKLSHLNSRRNFMHTIDRQKEQMELSNIKFSMMDDYNWLCEKNIDIPDSKFALIVPGGSKSRTNKRIPKLLYEKIIKFLLKKKIKPILIGSLDDKKICSQLSLISKEILNLCTQTSIGQLFFLAKHSFFSIGNDTGPMHIIARANKKTLVFFTKFSDPKLCEPTGKNVEILQYSNDNSDFFLTIKKSLQKFI